MKCGGSPLCEPPAPGFRRISKSKRWRSTTSSARWAPEPNAWARQVITYWEMVASFLTAGVLSDEIFYQSGRELLFVWIRVQPILAEARAFYKDPAWWKNLETAGNAFAEYTKKSSPEGYENFVARVRG